MHLRDIFILLMFNISAETIAMLGGMLKHLSDLIQTQCIYIALVACGELRTEPERAGILVEDSYNPIQSQLCGANCCRKASL